MSMAEKELWLPDRVAPTKAKEIGKEGGTYFDDELLDAKVERAKLVKMAGEMAAHINERPDHVVYVGSSKDRTEMREVFNWWKKEGIINHNPNIRIEYGVPEGAVRVAEDRE